MFRCCRSDTSLRMSKEKTTTKREYEEILEVRTKANETKWPVALLSRSLLLFHTRGLVVDNPRTGGRIEGIYRAFLEKLSSRMEDKIAETPRRHY